ncbi:MAG: amidophosphoribosyltransferase [Ignavibacteria bacterium RIFOXYB2_FULL_35_12]|nr:MAG: amidophosphoribosyltransferase [Ignavibacteria bacterium GWA2_36_19]OGU57980.1 MAG: amidophosphoribosyltransferase [Ignavibacteria bacterium GWF2_35_20]OGU78061.1 MAG: amidophosphoribosyltransferase [Ignavibacteria bacterium RIFOXYA2_FULL_35_9]OGU90509.1 MAG: amidophosphoribosyltransferase [Ignavibacteria bacterium RIFOXYC12_FULL_35_11]OGU91930.1 MAG: amidophosphoribosyltransferase [Ignavibacteria bacterium RIFOXYA12_FULL_35_25]OGU95115.1 MAG: amidophosphoribosyltransferase [Ignavibact
MIIQPDKPKCHCGIFGIFGAQHAALQTYYGLHALQHRGQEASGIVSKNINSRGHNVFNIHKGVGLVTEVFADQSVFHSSLPGTAAIGHNRYSTTGASKSRKNIQPFVVNYRLGNLAVAHNGNLTNAKLLREELVNEGAIFQTTSDTEVILHLIARSKLDSQIEQIKEALLRIEGAYSLVILTDDKLIAARDPYGFRPLSLGKLNKAFVFASETCSFDLISASFLREVEPGEIVVINDRTLINEIPESYQINNLDFPQKHCIFEYIYFSRPDSFIFGHNVDKMRRRLGKVLARKHPVRDRDGEKVIVISVPDSSNTMALGYQTELEKQNISSKLEIGLIRSHYIGRTFIIPGQGNREVGVRIKFNTVKGVLNGRTVVLIDDSIVRGTTSKQLVHLIREANPKEIHLRISSPPITHPCYYGMDFPSKEELIANRFNVDINSIKNYLEVDSLEYLTIEEMLEAVAEANAENFCTACFSGIYPSSIDSTVTKEMYEI